MFSHCALVSHVNALVIHSSISVMLFLHKLHYKTEAFDRFKNMTTSLKTFPEWIKIRQNGNLSMSERTKSNPISKSRKAELYTQYIQYNIGVLIVTTQSMLNCPKLNRLLIVPLQVTPFPEYPSLHVHVKLPSLLLHVACGWQSLLPCVHSSLSERKKWIVV